jgi:pimeloyl-ACP methyl ester carboxylesterase
MKLTGGVFLRALFAVVTLLSAGGQVSGQVVKPPDAAKKKPPQQTPRVVHFMTEDGVRIEADYYLPKKSGAEKAPVAILVHMYPADRASWKPLVPHLREAGLAVLAYDIRGRGGSVEPAEKELSKLYRGRDSAHFNNAWKDAAAAKKWLAEQPECDPTRVAMIGASIGCSISLDYGRREKAIQAIVCLSPGTDYFGVDSISHIKECGPRAILLISPEGEYRAVTKLIQASGGAAQGRKYAGDNRQHGTKLFLSEEGKEVKRKIVSFVEKALGIKNDKKSNALEDLQDDVGNVYASSWPTVWPTGPRSG